MPFPSPSLSGPSLGDLTRDENHLTFPHISSLPGEGATEGGGEGGSRMKRANVTASLILIYGHFGRMNSESSREG